MDFVYDHIWAKYFGAATTAECPICRRRDMRRDCHPVEYTDKAWRMAKIGPEKDILPVCYTCAAMTGSEDILDMADRMGYSPNWHIIPPRENECFCCIT